MSQAVSMGQRQARVVMVYLQRPEDKASSYLSYTS